MRERLCVCVRERERESDEEVGWAFLTCLAGGTGSLVCLERERWARREQHSRFHGHGEKSFYHLSAEIKAVECGRKTERKSRQSNLTAKSLLDSISQASEGNLFLNLFLSPSFSHLSSVRAVCFDDEGCFGSGFFHVLPVGLHCVHGH